MQDNGDYRFNKRDIHFSFFHMMHSSAIWRRLAIDIRLHNQAVVAHPHRPAAGFGVLAAVCATGGVLGATIDGGLGFLVTVIGAGMFAFDKNPADNTPGVIADWRRMYKIAPDAILPEPPEKIPVRLIPDKDNYAALLQAAKTGDFDE
jgi:hypothetical protein